jgi:LmbE family N-acetylglucosaminyl deacetylase
LPDLHLEYVKNLEDILDACISIVNPDLIFAFDNKFPWRPIVHPDHIAVGEAISKIVKKEVNRNISLIFYATRKPNTVIDISNSIGSKISAIKQHRSQLRFGTKPYGYLTKKFAGYYAKKTFGQYVEVFRLEDSHFI